jgi:hypothetical protein
MNARRLAIVMALAASSAMNAQGSALLAQCNCTSEGKCAWGTCCFNNGDCTPDRTKCKATGSQGSYSCGAGDVCTYSGSGCS